MLKDFGLGAAAVLSGLRALATWSAPAVVARVWPEPEGAALHAAWAVAVVVAVALVVVVALMSFVLVTTTLSGPVYERMAEDVLRAAGRAVTPTPLFAQLKHDLATSAIVGGVGIVLFVGGLLPGVGLVLGALAVAWTWLGAAYAAASPAMTLVGLGVGARLRTCLRAAPFFVGAGGVIAVLALVPLLSLVVMPAAVLGLTRALAARGSI
jgi:uncharacterized protein involved in cysteine biosynthesis